LKLVVKELTGEFYDGAAALEGAQLAVARLVATGLTNREVVSQLYPSPRRAIFALAVGA